MKIQALLIETRTAVGECRAVWKSIALTHLFCIRPAALFLSIKKAVYFSYTPAEHSRVEGATAWRTSMNRKTVCFSVIGLVGFLGTPSVQAATDLIYSGNGCQAYWGSEVTDINAYNSSVYNKSTTLQRWVSCPIVTHNSTNVNGPQFVYARVKRGTITGISLSCYLRSYSSTGTLLDTDSVLTSASSPTSLSLDVETSGNAGYYTLTCNLPPQSYVYSYRVGEP